MQLSLSCFDYDVYREAIVFVKKLLEGIYDEYKSYQYRFGKHNVKDLKPSYTEYEIPYNDKKTSQSYQASSYYRSNKNNRDYHHYHS